MARTVAPLLMMTQSAAAYYAVGMPTGSSLARAVAPAMMPVYDTETDITMEMLLESKRKVIEAHNADVDLTLEWLDRTAGRKEVRKQEDLPGADTTVLDGSLAGDYGWDPLNLAETRTHYLVYSEAEVKHGRLAMLGCLGWVMSELLHTPLAALTGSPSMLSETSGCAPSFLNGGLGQFGGGFWLAAFAVGAAIESNSLNYQFEGMSSSGKPWKYTPGDLAFDPLDLSTKLAKQLATTSMSGSAGSPDDLDLLNDIKRNIRNAEAIHGRVAMVAIVGFALQEAIWGKPIVEQTPLFFATPIWKVLTPVFGGLHDVLP